MDEEREVDLPLDKTYQLPKFTFINYNGVTLAIAPEIARWIVADNESQVAIMKDLIKGFSLGDLLEKYGESQDDIVSVLTQIEATGIETFEPKSVFQNTRLHLHLTNRCNMKCPHCYMESGIPYEDELSTEEIKNLCLNFKQIGGTDVSLTGGEPTTRADFFEIVEYLSSIGLRVSIFTNGLFWNESRVKRLALSDIEGVQISIDGYDEESNSVIRGKGAFDKALNAVDEFIKSGIYVKIAVTAPYELIKDNSDKYVEFSRRTLSKYGEEALEFNYSYFFMPGRELDSNAIKEQKTEYFNLVETVAKAVYGDQDEDSFVTNLIDGVYDSCGYGGLNVMANGDFYFCDRIPDVNKSGNVRNIPFDEIAELMKLAERMGKIDNFKPCNTCELKYICGGGCRAEFFRDFTTVSDIKDIDFEKISPRNCGKENKEKIYDLMIRTYERFYC